MNHLAHALLSGDQPDRILGGMLGDFVHGHVPTELRPGVQAGLRLHRAIDVFTDSHPAVVLLRSQFAPPYRRFAGIIIDVWFDHLLARNFAQWSAAPLQQFSDDLNALLLQHANELPEALRRFAAFMRAQDLPRAYVERATLMQVFAGLSARFSRANPLASALEETARLEGVLAEAFAAFFPDLVRYAAQQRVP
jgi:acyl carrier protein phosphodiesterase